MLKKILGVLALVVIAFLGYVALQPKEGHIERSVSIAAPPSAIFPHVNDLRQWNAWSPWAKLDPNAKVSFDGPAAGTGAKFAWSGNDQVGEGAMTIVDSKPDERIDIHTDFTKPFAGSSASDFTFKPEGNSTLVTWHMKNDLSSFFVRGMCIIFNGDKMMGAEFDKGLASLKAVVEGR